MLREMLHLSAEGKVPVSQTNQDSKRSFFGHCHQPGPGPDFMIIARRGESKADGPLIVLAGVTASSSSSSSRIA